MDERNERFGDNNILGLKNADFVRTYSFDVAAQTVILLHI